MTELLLITIVIALLLLVFVRWFPVSRAPQLLPGTGGRIV